MTKDKSITLMERKECPLCGSDVSVMHIPFPEIPVVRCSNCDFIYSSKTLSAQDLISYYANNFGSQRHMLGQIVNSKINSLVIKKLMNFQGIRNILDVGTGYGFFLAELCKYDEQLVATGVELSRQEAEYARNNLGLNVINSPLRNSGINKASFDLVTSFEVIEHTAYPVEFIKELTDYVKPGGYLLIMTDNFESRMAKSLGAGFPKWIPHSHISHFSSDRLRKTVESVKNLTIVNSMSYTPWEILVRNAFYKVCGMNKAPSDAFDLTTTLESEMDGKYKLFVLRKLINKLWAQFTLSKKMDGDLIYFLARRIV